ncbi:MAG: glycosyltransferase family 39 protein [Deltaproteobacteria bacterium]|nr:glycosyltransferase family 39 protein [Deltaproteobacteria bacterium]
MSSATHALRAVGIEEKLTTSRANADVTTRSRTLALACIVVVAGFLDLHNLGSQPFWTDEVVTYDVATSHGLGFVKLATRNASMAFYHLVLHGWVMLVPPTDFNIRLLATVFAVAAVVAVYVLARKLFGSAVGLAAAALLAVNPFFLNYAQEARSYTLTVFLVLLSWSFFIESCRHPKLLNLAIYIAATTLAIYSHNLAMLILPAQFVAIFLFREEARLVRIRLAGALCIAFLLVSPLFLIAALLYRRDNDWIAASIGPPGLNSLREVLGSFAAGTPAPRIAGQLLELLFVAGAFLYFQRFVTASRRGSKEFGSYALIVGAFALPIALLMGVSQLEPLFIPRYVLICLPFLVVMVAVGWLLSGSRLVAAVGLMLLVGLSLRVDQSYYLNPYKPDWPEATKFIVDNARHGDKLAFVPSYGRFEFEHNLQRVVGGDSQLTIIYPTVDAAGHSFDSLSLMKIALNTPCDRLWVVSSGEMIFEKQVFNELMLNSKYGVVFRENFRGISVTFYGHSAMAALH